VNKKPLNQRDRQIVANLQKKLDDLRRRFKIRDRGEVLFRENLSYSEHEVALVEADGFGGGVLRVVEGNYPVDYFTREESAFSTEAEAEIAAVALASGQAGNVA